MTPVTDFRIYQRDKDGFADVLFTGTLTEAAKDCVFVWARAVREEDGYMVYPWTPCALTGGQWQITMRLPQGGLYRLEAGASASPQTHRKWDICVKIVRHVGVGEVYMLAGQSNMAGYGRDIATDPPALGVHLFGNNGKWRIASHPLNDSFDTIYPENRENACASSPALSFGRTMSKWLNLPVGLVQTAKGATALSEWNPEEDGYLTHAMYRRLEIIDKVGGVAWYQGCTDTRTEELASTYLERFTHMVAHWREKMGQIPIITVQINRSVNAEPERDVAWGIVREAQRQAARQIPNVYVVPSVDMTMGDHVHNSSASNVTIGERMAMGLLPHYGLPGLKAPSVEKVVRMDDTHVLVRFDTKEAIGTLTTYGKGANLEDADGLIDCIYSENTADGIVYETERPFALPARFHMQWQSCPYPHGARSLHGMPVLACYGVPVEE